MDQLGQVQREADAMHRNGIYYLAPLCQPGVARLENTTNQYNNGYSDGGIVCNAIISVIDQSGGRITMPGNMQLRVYLDIESGTTNFASYWEGWYDPVNAFEYYNGVPYYPFYPCAYCNPTDGISCSQLTKGGSGYYPYTIWTSEPENYCSCCYVNPGNSADTWGNQKNCIGIYTSLWQYAESDRFGNTLCSGCRGGGNGNCGAYGYFGMFPGVDLNVSTSAEDERAYMLYVAS